MSPQSTRTEKAIHYLLAAVGKENEQRPFSQPKLSDHSKAGHVEAGQRDCCAQRMLRIGAHFGFQSDTCLQAVKFFDNFLAKVKVTSKYLDVISLSALLLSAKLLEEEEMLMSVEEMVVAARSTCSSQDVIRMEGIMLEKFDWQLMLPTSLTFVEKYCELLQCLGYFSSTEKLSIVSRCTVTLLRIVVDSSFLQHSSTTIALATLAYELSFFKKSMVSAYSELSAHAGIHDSELMHCGSLLRSVLDADLLTTSTEKRKRKKRTHSTSSISPSRTMPTIWEAGDDNSTQSRYGGSKKRERKNTNTTLELDEGGADDQVTTTVVEKQPIQCEDAVVAEQRQTIICDDTTTDLECSKVDVGNSCRDGAELEECGSNPVATAVCVPVEASEDGLDGEIAHDAQTIGVETELVAVLEPPITTTSTNNAAPPPPMDSKKSLPLEVCEVQPQSSMGIQKQVVDSEVQQSSKGHSKLPLSYKQSLFSKPQKSSSESTEAVISSDSLPKLDTSALRCEMFARPLYSTVVKQSSSCRSLFEKNSSHGQAWRQSSKQSRVC